MPGSSDTGCCPRRRACRSPPARTDEHRSPNSTHTPGLDSCDHPSAPSAFMLTPRLSGLADLRLALLLQHLTCSTVAETQRIPLRLVAVLARKEAKSCHATPGCPPRPDQPQ